MSSNDYNKVTLIGRLTRDADLKYTTTGTAIAAVSLASNRSVKKQDNWETEVSYFDGNIYGRMAENLKPYLTKGKMILIAGHLKQDRWEKDGQKQSRITIQADNCYLLGGKSEGGAAPQSAPAPQNDGGYEPQSGDFPEDIPF